MHDDGRLQILKERSEYDADMELEEWTVPKIRCAFDAGPRCPTCGSVLVFERFTRIRPPPLTHRGNHQRSAHQVSQPASNRSVSKQP